MDTRTERQYEARIKAEAEATIRDAIGRGQPVNPMSIAGGMVEWWARLGADCEGRAPLLQACGKWAREKIAELQPAPAPPAPAPAEDEPSQALYEHYRENPEHVDLKPHSLTTVARRGNCRGRYNRLQRGDAAIEIQIDDGGFRAYSDELHAAQFWGRCEEVATCNGRPWREPTQKRRREMLLRWVGTGAYDGTGTDVVQDVLDGLESLPNEREFVPRDEALKWARAQRTTETDAPNAVGNEVWADIRKAFAAHGQRPGNDPWREHRITISGRRVRGWARREGRPTGVRLVS